MNENTYNYRTDRSQELKRSNRRVGLIVLIVVMILVVGTIIYVAYFGGANSERDEPLRSGFGVAETEERG